MAMATLESHRGAAHIQCTRNNTLKIHGCNILKHANDTLVHYNAYRAHSKKINVKCDTKTELVTTVKNNTPIIVNERCIAYIAKIAAWTTTTTTTTIQTRAYSTLPQIQAGFRNDTTTTPKNTHDQTSNEKISVQILVVIIIIGIVAVAAFAWIIRQKCIHKNTTIIIQEQEWPQNITVEPYNNNLYEIPVATIHQTQLNSNDPLYDNV